MKKFDSVRKNVVANFLGRVWISATSLVCVPFFIKLVGIEAYGLMGFFISLIAILAVLDLGLSSTLSRQLSRLSVVETSDQEIRDLVKTFEILYWGVGIVIGLGIIFLAPLIATQWINAEGIEIHIVEMTIKLMGLCLAFQWPASLYTGGLMGLQRQVLLNGIRVVIVTFQYGGAVLVLWLISSNILTFFLWQLLISIINTFVLKICLWKILPGVGLKASFQKVLLKKNWKFAAGMTGISSLVTVVTQLDKVILSKMLTLEFFGYYMLAFNVANVINYASAPFFMALFPKFSQIIANQKDDKELAFYYHRGTQFLAVVVFSISITVAIFSKSLLFLWLGNIDTVQNTYRILSCKKTYN